MEPYLIYGGVALGGWLLRHFNIGTNLGNSLLSLVNLQPIAPVPAAAPVAAPVVAPVAPSPILSEAEAAIVSLIQQVKASMSTQVQANLQTLLQQVLTSMLTPPAAAAPTYTPPATK